ncbi:MAG: transcription antitermination factor NusB [Planctomycetota bacterium]
MDGRSAALAAVARQARDFPALRPAEPESGLDDPRERHLARAMYDTTLRRWLTLAAMLDRRLRRPLHETDADTASALLVGAAQLWFLDRIPPHAAIDSTVEWLKGRGKYRTSGVVNAVLRRMAEARAAAVLSEQPAEPTRSLPLDDGRWLITAEAELPEDALSCRASAWSLPENLVRRICHERSDDAADAFCRAALAAAPLIVRAPAGIDGSPVAMKPHEHAGHYVAERADGVFFEWMREQPGMWVQDPSSSGAVDSIRDRSPRVIADVCAGVGTKTRQLAEAFPGAEVLASDTDKKRFAELRRVFDGHERVRVVSRDELASEGLGRCDLVLLDVPCSNSGVLSRRVEARYRTGDRELKRMRDLQRQIVADAIPLLAPSGAILYATCSVERIENEGIAEWAERWHGLKRELERSVWPLGGPGVSATHHRDGAYSVLLRR